MVPASTFRRTLLTSNGMRNRTRNRMAMIPSPGVSRSMSKSLKGGRIRQRLGRAAAGDGATLACRIDGLDQEPVTSRDPHAGGELTRSEHAEQLDDLAIEIELHQPLALPVETGHRFGVIHDAALQGQS